MPYSEAFVQLARDTKSYFATEAARPLLDHLRRFCRADDTTYVVGDSHLSAFNEGARSVYLELLNLINFKEESNALYDADTIEDIAI